MRPGYVKLVENVALPKLSLVRQNFKAQDVDDVARTVHDAIAAASFVPEQIRPGMSVALTVGSRGLASLPELVRAIVIELKALGAVPFIVPSMGSHGGATAEGQTKVLAQLGVTEETAGCPIRSSMETVEVGVLDNGMSVRIDKLAYEADGIVLFNRIKPHSAFRWENESGLAKMLSIGLGKQSGADNCHAWGFNYVGRFVVEMARVKLATCKVLFGIGTVENAYDRLSKVVVLPAEGLIENERTYLAEAMRNMPRLPLGPLDQPLASGPLDVLLVDYVGKEFSGSGMDPNITGRPSTTAIKGGPSVSRICVLDVTDKSQGNANGVARADVITERLFDRFDRESVYTNSLTSGVLIAASLPMAMPDEKTAIQAAVKTCESHTPDAITMIRIPNTLHLEYLYASEALLPQIASRPGIEILGEAVPMRFDAAGKLLDPWPNGH
ncbi:lactate racemase domain-containing protein [Xanthobacteraceae bacterium A53D]